MPQCYKVDSRNIAFREYWNITPSWKVLFAWGAKILRIPLKLASGFQHFESVKELEIAESDFSPRAREKLQPLLEQCLHLGFQSPRFFRFESLNRQSQTSFISLLHPSGEAGVRLIHTIASNVHPAIERTLVTILSELNDGSYLVSSNQRAQFLSAPGVRVNRQVGATPDRLWATHQQQLAGVRLRNPPKPIASQEALDQTSDKYEKLGLDDGVRRGRYVPMSLAEVEAERNKLAAAQAMSASGVEHADVLLELQQLQEKKTGWGNAIVLFVISMVLFVGAGSRQWSWKYALMLVPILFFHELGHYLAMRAFDYRNLRMFFIPFFGAAVAGRHYNVPGWKKVVVSLMGPVPGIVLGAILGGAGILLQQPLLTRIALVMLILNGINLVPVLPLDGGWVFHTLLFSRHHLLDAVFRVVAVIALMTAGLFTRDKILLYVSIPMLIGLPAAYRMARIATNLRQRGLPPTSPDDQTIPPATAQAIITEVKQASPKATTNKIIAQQTLQIFETLNASPPGWPATIGFLFVHVASIGMAAVFAAIAIAGPRGGLAGTFPGRGRLPKHSLACGSSSVWKGTNADEFLDQPRNTIVATFRKEADAIKTVASFANRLPTSASIRTFGDSILVTLSSEENATRKELIKELHRQTKEVFVDSTNFRAGIFLSCRAPNEQLAKELENELNNYFLTIWEMHLLPPWNPENSGTPEQKRERQLARQTYARLLEMSSRENESEMFSLQKKIVQAQRQGDLTEVADLRNQHKRLLAEREKRHIENVRSGNDGPVDTAVIDLYSALLASRSGTNAGTEKILQQLAARMGSLPLIGEQPALKEGRFSAQYGTVVREGSLLQFTWLSFASVADGAPSLVEWLCAKGCRDFKYNFNSNLSLGGSDEL